MPMIPEAFIAMHAVARIGAIHCVVFGGFAPEELSSRLNHTKAKMIITASTGIEPNKLIPYIGNVDKACQLAGIPELKRIIVQRPEHLESNLDSKVYLDYYEEMAKVQTGHDCVPVEGEHPFFTMYTSGTTGQPKGIYRSHGGMLVAYNYSQNFIFDIQRGNVMMATSDIGWIVGHQFIIYGPLIRGGTSVMYEGKPAGTPDAGVMWRMIQEYKVKSFFIAPTGIRAIKKDDYEGELIKNYDLSSLESVHLAGERCDPETFKWILQHLPDKHLNDNWWQTETGWPMSCNYINLTTFPTKIGSATKPTPGWDVRLMDDNDKEIHEHNITGKIVVKLPCPPGHMDGLWGNDESYIQKYLESPAGYYLTGDAGVFDEDGYL